jgi:transposase
MRSGPRGKGEYLVQRRRAARPAHIYAWFLASAALPALTARGITPCIPSKANRKVQIPHDRILYRQRHKIENMFGRLKDWRRIHTRYDRCAHTFFSAICIAATVIYWINQ